MYQHESKEDMVVRSVDTDVFYEMKLAMEAYEEQARKAGESLRDADTEAAISFFHSVFKNEEKAVFGLNVPEILKERKHESIDKADEIIRGLLLENGNTGQVLRNLRNSLDEREMAEIIKYNVDVRDGLEKNIQKCKDDLAVGGYQEPIVHDKFFVFTNGSNEPVIIPATVENMKMIRNTMEKIYSVETEEKQSRFLNFENFLETSSRSNAIEKELYEKDLMNMDSSVIDDELIR